MYAGISSGVNSASNAVALDNDTSSDIPEWKKLLIMKKRAGNSPSADEYTRRNLDSSAGGVNNVRNGGCSNTCESIASGGVSNKFGWPVKAVEQDSREILPPKTVTIGNINVELRSVGQDPCTEVESTGKNRDGSQGEDIRYGPGIVDRLRAKFLSICAQKECKPVVRRFSSLENLPGSNSGPYRVNTRGFRQNGFRASTGNYPCTGNVKKAQSMETLICVTPEQQIFASSRRPNARYVGGVKARILAKNISPICTLTDENDEPNEKTPSPASSPRLFAKSLRRWDYNRSTSASNINEDELPKRDTVKQVKRLFESPPVVNSSEKPSNHPSGLRFRKIPGTNATSTSACNNGAISGSVRPAVKKPDIGDDCLDAKTSAKELSNTNVNILSEKEEDVLSLEGVTGNHDDNKINKADFSPVLDDNLSAIRSCDTLLSKEDGGLPSPDSYKSSLAVEENADIVESSEAFVKVTVEQLPLLESSKHSEVLSQGSRVSQPSEAEPLEDDLPPHPRASGVSGGMVVAATASSGDGLSKKGNTWQKAPQATTSVVFDFRGKDVKPNIAINPTPFGCRPAKVSRSAKRAGSPPRSGVNGVTGDYGEEVNEPREEEDDDLEDWDQMDVGADLPVISGIVFTGENIKVGRGALLEKRNKKLSIQFDDKATSTFEYPSENASPSPMEENGYSMETFNSSVAMSSAANSRLGLSTYTPQVLSSKEFELGISQPNHRPTSSPLDSPEMIKDVPALDVIVPANPNDTGGWSATETADILF